MNTLTTILVTSLLHFPLSNKNSLPIKPWKTIKVNKSQNRHVLAWPNHITQLEKIKHKKDWWQSATFYHVYIRSFKDSDGDGIGDLQGIISKLQHFKELGIKAIWLSPIFKSPQIDHGYDTSDYEKIDPIFGSKEDLKDLLIKSHKLAIKVILDFVPNHTSNEHKWFQKSVEKVKGFEDFFVWNPGFVDSTGIKRPPNNWNSVFKGSAWKWHDKRQEFFLHQFEESQPDLNFRNPLVVKALNNILLYWLDFGVDGFRIDAVPHLLEDKNLEDEPLSGLPRQSPEDYDFYAHTKTKDHDESYDLLYDWRDFLDNYTKIKGGETRLLMSEGYTSFENTIRYFGNKDGSRLGPHVPFYFEFVDKLNANSMAFDVFSLIAPLMFAPDFVTYNWQIGNHDNHRPATRLGKENTDGFNMLTVFLKGIPVTYYGDEIGQENGEVLCKEGQDPKTINNCTTFDVISRDFERTPFQWDDSENGGFSNGNKSWLPVSKKTYSTNLKLQKLQENSHYNIYKKVLSLKEQMFKIEEQNIWEIFSVGATPDNVIQVTRIFLKEDLEVQAIFLLLFNLSKSPTKSYAFETDKVLEIVIASENSQYKIGQLLDSKQIALNGHECIILKKLLENDKIFK